MSILTIYSQNRNENQLFGEIIAHNSLDSEDYHELKLGLISKWSGHLPYIATSFGKWIYSFFSLWNNFMYI